MCKLIVFFLCLFPLSSFSATPKKILNIQHWKALTGSQVYFVHVPNLPILDVRVIFSAGSVYDGKQEGIASLTNSMMGEGTDIQNANQIAKTFDNIEVKPNRKKFIFYSSLI